MKTTTRWTFRAVILLLLALLILPSQIPRYQLQLTLSLHQRQTPLTRRVEVAEDSIITTVTVNMNIWEYQIRSATPIERPLPEEDAAESAPGTPPP